MIRHFRNEAGEDVTIDIYEKEVGGIENVSISITRPESEDELELTKGEAQALLETLGKALGWKK